MKTKLITKLKKELLIIELPEGTISYQYSINLEIISAEVPNYKGFSFGQIRIGKGFTLLGTPDEIKDEDLDGILSDFDAFQNTGEGTGFYDYKKGFFDIVEKEIHWVNPLNNKLDKSQPLIIQTEHLSKWKEAQEKTFDKSRTLIFVKN